MAQEESTPLLAAQMALSQPHRRARSQIVGLEHGTESKSEERGRERALANDVLKKIAPMHRSMGRIPIDERYFSHQKALEDDIEAAIDRGDAVTIIQKLNVHEDYAQGIVSEYTEAKSVVQDNGVGLAVYLRDAREQSLRQKGNDKWQSYAMIGLTYKEAVKRKMADLLTDEEETQLSASAKIFFQQIKQLDSAKTAEQHTAYYLEKILVPFLANKLLTTPEHAKEIIIKCKDFAGLDHAPCVKATFTRHATGQEKSEYAKNKFNGRNTFDVMHIDRPIYQLTYALEEEYRGRENKDWYKIQSEDMRREIDIYCNKVLDQGYQTVLPTIFIGRMPGIRNSGEDQLFHIDSRTRKVVEKGDIGRGYHLGNLGTELYPKSGETDVSKDQASIERHKVTGLNVDQFKERTGAEHIITAGLTSSSPMLAMAKPLASEHDMNEQIYEQIYEQKRDDLHHSTMPGNGYRVLVDNRYDGIDFVLNMVTKIVFSPDMSIDQLSPHTRLRELAAKYPDGIPDRCYLLPKYRSEDGSDDGELARYNGYKDLINVAVRLAALRHRTTFWHLDGNNQNLQMDSHAKHLVDLLNRIADTNFAYADFCKSGKDREGIARIVWMSMMLYHYKTGDPLTLNSATSKRVIDDYTTCFEPLICAGAIQRSAGDNSFGCAKVKKAATTAIPLVMRYLDSILIGRAAKFNKKSPELKEKTPKIKHAITLFIVLFFLLAVQPLATILAEPLSLSPLIFSSVGTFALSLIFVPILLYAWWGDKNKQRKNIGYLFWLNVCMQIFLLTLALIGLAPSSLFSIVGSVASFLVVLGGIYVAYKHSFPKQALKYLIPVAILALIMGSVLLAAVVAHLSFFSYAVALYALAFVVIAYKYSEHFLKQWEKSSGVKKLRLFIAFLASPILLLAFVGMSALTGLRMYVESCANWCVENYHWQGWRRVLYIPAYVGIFLFAPCKVMWLRGVSFVQYAQEHLFTWRNLTVISVLGGVTVSLLPTLLGLTLLAEVLTIVSAFVLFFLAIGSYLKYLASDECPAYRFPPEIAASGKHPKLQRVKVSARAAYYLPVGADGMATFNQSSHYIPKVMYESDSFTIDARCTELLFSKDQTAAGEDLGILRVKLVGGDLPFQISSSADQAPKYCRTVKKVASYLKEKGYTNRAMLKQLDSLGCYKVTIEGDLDEFADEAQPFDLESVPILPSVQALYESPSRRYTLSDQRPSFDAGHFSRRGERAASVDSESGARVPNAQEVVVAVLW